MATKNTEVAEMLNYLQILQNSIKKQFTCDLISDTDANVTIVKRNKRLQRADFTIIMPLSKPSTLAQHSNFKTRMSPDSINIQQVDLTGRDTVLVTEVKQDTSGTFNIKLLRKDLFRAMIKEVLNKKNEFGKFAFDASKNVAINISFLHKLQSDYLAEVTLSRLRVLLVCQHTSALLHANGYPVKQLHYNNISEQYKSICTKFGVSLQESDIVYDEACLKVTENLRHSLTETTYKYKNTIKRKEQMHEHSSSNTLKSFKCQNQESTLNKDCSQSGVSGGDGDLTTHESSLSGDDGSLTTYDSCQMASNSEDIDNLLDLKQFIKDKRLAVGGDSYDLNISLADFSEGTQKFKEICQLESNVNILPIVPDVCVHVVQYEQAFSQQQLDLGWKILGHSAKNIYQVHLPVGPVTLRKCAANELLPTAEALLSMRRKQMREAFRMKYGDQVQGDGWDSTIETLTIAAVKFEFLTTNNRSPLKLDVCETVNGLSDSKGGVFVMYNYARLCTLFRNLDTAVTRGVYPPLPPIESVQFCCLKEQEEWELMFNYILPYPSVVSKCVSSLSCGKPKAPIHVHKVCQFLLDFCRDFSSYYNRIHILCEPRQHLLQTMYARLYLLKAVQQVMHNALTLLHIQPLSQL